MSMKAQVVLIMLLKVVMFLTNPEVPGSNLGQNTSYPVEVICGFPHSLYTTARRGIKIRPQQFIIQSELQTALCTVCQFIIQTRATDSTLYSVPLHYTDKSY